MNHQIENPGSPSRDSKAGSQTKFRQGGVLRSRAPEQEQVPTTQNYIMKEKAYSIREKISGSKKAVRQGQFNTGEASSDTAAMGSRSVRDKGLFTSEEACLKIIGIDSCSSEVLYSKRSVSVLFLVQKTLE